jgi:hypothetical protein
MILQVTVGVDHARMAKMRLDVEIKKFSEDVPI